MAKNDTARNARGHKNSPPGEHNHRRTVMSNKPKWVESLEAAEAVLKRAEQAEDPAQQGSLNAMAHTYLAIAREYRGSPSTD